MEPEFEVLKLKRNDLKGALRFAEGLMDKKKWTGEIGHVLLSLQDDPSRLEEELTRLLAERGL